MILEEMDLTQMTVTELLDVFGNMDNVQEAINWYYQGE